MRVKQGFVSVAALCLILVVALLAPTAAAQSIWTSGASDNWSNIANWNGGAGPVPVSADTTQLVFNADTATTYTAFNDIGPFTLNAVTFNNTGTGLITLSGTDLTFAGVNPAITSTGSGPSLISMPIIHTTGTAVTNSGAGTLTLSGQTFANGVTITNSGSGTTVLSDGVAYSGSNVNINLANTGTGVFNVGNFGGTLSGTINVTSGAVKFAGSTGGDLFGDALILNVASNASFDFAGNAEGFGGISGGGNIIMGSAGLTFSAPGDRTFTGAISGTGAVTQNNAGTLTLGGANAYTGATTIQAGGTIRATAANVLAPTSPISILAGLGTLDTGGFSQTIGGLAGGSPGAALTVNSGNTLTINGTGTSTRLFNGAIVGAGGLTIGGTAVQGFLGTNTYTGATTINGGTLRVGLASLATTSGITLNGGALDTIVTADATWNKPLSGTGSLVKSGPGNLTFNAPTGATLTTLALNGGTLTLNRSADNGATFGGTPALVLNNGSLAVAGNGSAASAQNFSGTTLTGAGKVNVAAGTSQNATVALGAITRTIGSTLNVGLTNNGSGVANVTTTANNGAAGIVGGWATVNGTDWATTGTGAGPFNVAPFAGYTPNAWTAGAHVDVTSSFNIGTAAPAASVRFNAPAASTLTLVGTNALSTGGVLVTPNVGANGTTITGGTLTAAAANQELFVHQYDTAGTLTISSVIGNTPGTPVQMTVATLTNTTTMTVPSTAGLFPGMILTATTNTPNNIPTTINAHVVSVNSPTQVTISFKTDVSGGPAAPVAGTNVPVTFTPGTYVVKDGPGTLVLTAANTFNGALVLNEGTVSVGALNNMGSSATGASSSVIFNGGTLRITGAFNGSSGLQPYIFGPAGGTIEIANAGQSHAKQGNSISGTGTLTKTGPGTLSIGSNGSAFSGLVVVNGGTLRFQSNQFQSAAGMTVNPGGQYEINDDAAAGTFRLATTAVMNLSGAGPAGSATPGAFIVTDQSPNAGAPGGPGPIFPTAVQLTGDATVGVYNGNGGRISTLNFTNQVGGAGSLLKTGSGVLVLHSAANNYAGATVISNGTLRINTGNNRLPVGTTLQFGETGSTNAGTFDLNGNSQTVAGLTSTGSSTAHQIINSAATGPALPVFTVNYTGATPQTYAGIVGDATGANGNFDFVKSGSGYLTLSGPTTYTGATTVAGGSLRVFSNTLGRPYTVADGAALVVANPVASTPFAASTLTLGTSGTTTLGFELLDGAPANGVLNVGGGNGLTANGAVNVSVASAQPLTVGQVPLVKYQGTIQGGGFGAFSLGTLTLPSRVLGHLVNTGSSIDLSVTGVDFIKWTGANGAAWDVNQSSNWKLASNNSPTTYLENPAPGDTVVFDETAAGPHTIDLTTTLTPSAVTVSGPADYTFGGSGRLTGGTGLNKQGAGTLTVLTNNTNSGATTISGGVLRVGNGGTSGSIGSGAVVNNGSLVVDRSDDVTLTNNLSGSGSLTKNGAGTLSLSGGFALTGNTTINAGTLALSGGTYGGNISGAGALAKNGVGTLVLTGNATHAGGTTVAGGVLQIGDGNTSGTIGGPIALAGGTTLLFNRADNSTSNSALSGAGSVRKDGAGSITLTGAMSYTGDTVVAAGNIEFASDANFTHIGKLNSANAGVTLTKSGAGTMTFLNTNTFLGDIVINGGAILLDDQNSGGDFNGVRTITINPGAKFTFGATAGSNPDLPEGEAGARIDINGGEFEFRIGEVWSGTRLRNNGTFRFNGFNAGIGSTCNATGGDIFGYMLESGTIVAENVGTGTGTLTGIVTKTTPGTVTFSGRVAMAAANTISILDGVLSFDATNVPATGTGGITLGDAATTGVFRMTGPGAANSSRAVFAPTSGAIDIPDAGGTLTLTGEVSGGGTLAKTGAGTLVLNPSLNFSGTMAVQAGTLRTSSGNTPSVFTVANGATLAVNNPGAAPLPLAVNGLTLGTTASTIAFQLDTSITPSFPLLQVLNPDALLTRGGAHAINLSDNQTLAPGQFTLIDYDGAPITSGFTLGTLPARTNAALVYNTANTSIDLNVIGIDSTLWNGTISGDWDVGTAADVGGTKNFKLASNGVLTNFITNDRATFDDTAAGTTTVNLTTALQPAALTVNNDAKTYTFQGPGSITGPTGLIKDGPGTLILATDNNYTGATTVTAGTLQVGNGGTTGSFTSNVSVAPAATLAFNRSNDITYSGLISGAGTVTKSGAGVLTLLAANPFNGSLVVNQGTVLLDDLGAGGDLNANSIVVNNGGTFVFGENGNADLPNATVVTVNAGGLFDLKQGEVYGGIVLKGGTYQMTSSLRTAVDTTAQPANGYVFESGTVTASFTGAASGGGLLGTTFLDKTTPGTVTISGAVTIGDGVSINVKEGTLSLGVANVPVGGTTTLTIGDAATTGTLQIRDAGTATSARPIAIGAGGGTVDVANAGGTLAFTNAVSGGGGGTLTKTGPGALVLSGANDYTGPTVAAGGTLRVTGSIAASSAVTVNTGGKFEAAASQKINALTVNTGGKVEVTASPAAKKVLTVVGDTPSVTGTGTIDLHNNGIVFDYTTASPLTSIRSLIVSGNANGWNPGASPSITSTEAAAGNGSFAIGYAEASSVALPPTGFLGQAVDGNAILVRYTLAGDATLDGAVDFNDLVKLAQNYNTTVSATTGDWWTNGDFTYDGVVDFNDLVKLAQNYNTALPSEPVPGAGVNFNADLAAAFAAVPEPTSFATLVACGLASTLVSRRRRRN